jgi:ubiquinone/menaquinone biosynthesis C-methylase UbiE
MRATQQSAEARQPDLDTIAEAFSRTAEKYDSFAVDHPHMTRLRNKVYRHLERVLPPAASILELNAGSGTDAVALAQRGYRVHATDIAPDMLARARDKVETLGLGDKVMVQECSFTNLDQVEGGPYDAILSNFGGLNCIADLTPVIEQLPRLLRPGGVVTWVLMPPVCVWEMAEVFRGHFRLAFRRFRRGGVRSHLEGLYFQVYYFSPGKVVRQFGPDYERIAVEGLSVLTPTAESKNFAKRWPRLYGALAWLDDRLSPLPPFQGWGDFFIVSLRYQPRPR